MDRVRKQSKTKLLRKLAIAVASMVLLYGAVSIANIDFETRRVARDTLLIGTVERGDLEIRISANGELLSRDLELVASQVDGRVAKIHVAPGDEVEAGQLLAEITNPQLVTAAEDAYSEWEGAVADLKAVEAELQNQILSQESLLLQTRFSLEKTRLELEAKRELHARRIISEIEFRRISLETEQLEQIVAIERMRLRQSKDNMDALLSVQQSRVSQLERALNLAEDRVSSLNMVAGIDGMVQEFDLELGQQLMAGNPVGRLARQGMLYAQLKVAARQAGDVVVGQDAVIDTRNGTANGSVSRIDPGVAEGTVIVDVDIHDPLPRGTRPQLQVEGTIYVAQIADALHVGRPVSIRTDANVYLYKLVEGGSYAEQVNVRMGRSSVNRVEILGGLEPGDRVILSDSSDWQDQQRILLN